MKQIEGRPAFFAGQNEHKQAKLAIRCSTCKRHEVGTDKVDCPPERASRHFTQRGWHVVNNGQRATCPECQKKKPQQPAEPTQADFDRLRERAERMQAPQPAEQPSLRLVPQEPVMKTDPDNRPPPAVEQRSPTAYKAQRLAHDYLREHFEIDEDTGDPATSRGHYVDDWSDAKVAKESGLSVDEVIRLRDGGYARLVDPREVKLLADIAAVRAKWAADEAEIRGMLDAARGHVETSLSRLESQLAAIRGPRGAAA